MRKSYNTSADSVNPPLFLCDPTIEMLERCGTCSTLRWARMGVDFEEYRDDLERAAREGRARQRQRNRKGAVSGLSLFGQDELGPDDTSKIRLVSSSAGRPSLDAVLMFRITFLGQVNHISDEKMSLMIMSDAVTRHFLKVPPGTFISRQAIWQYRQFFVESEVCETIAAHHMSQLRKEGLIGSDGPLILDASFVEAPKQRNTREENIAIKEGRGADLWNDQPAKKRQKDVDARWTKKNKEVHFGYKIHALVDAVHKFIIHVVTTPANVHDSRALSWVLNEEEDAGRTLYADSAYCGKELEEIVRDFNVLPCFCEKGYKNRPLTEEQKKNNRKKSSVRCRIEHVFGHVETCFNGSFVRSIGQARATAHNWLLMLGYNLSRQEMYCRRNE